MGKSSYTASTISISLLLLLLGVVGYFTIGAQKVARDLAAGVKVTVFLDQEATPEQRSDIEQRLRSDAQIVSFAYISPEAATADFEKNTGIRVDTTLGTNPIPASYDITPRSLDVASGIEKRISQWDGISETHYPKEIGTELTRKMNFAKEVSLYLGALLLLVTLSLIYYTLKLSILSSWEAIRTMQMVGARNSFIKRPYIKRAVIQGFIAAIIASGLLILLIELYSAQMGIPLERDSEYWKLMGMIGSSLCVAGVTICTLFTVIVLGIIVKKRKK